MTKNQYKKLYVMFKYICLWNGANTNEKLREMQNENKNNGEHTHTTYIHTHTHEHTRTHTYRQCAHWNSHQMAR